MRGGRLEYFTLIILFSLRGFYFFIFSFKEKGVVVKGWGREIEIRNLF